MFQSPGQIAFNIGFIQIHYYGLTMALALLVGVMTANLICKKYYPETNPEIIYDISPHLILGAIIGARLYYCLLCYKYYFQNPLEIIQIWHGGLSIHGALLGGLITGILYAKLHKLNILKLCDIFAYALTIGQAIGRWGNFFNSEAFGFPTQNFLKLYIPVSQRPFKYINYDYFQPTFLYESLFDICIFLVLFFIIRRYTKNTNGIIFFSYLILYSLVRIIIEQIRIDSVLNLFGIPIAQLVSILMILIGLIGTIIVLQQTNEAENKI